jgi:hypothetical protein
MKIHHIIGEPPIIISNEERDFIKEHGDTVSIGFLDEHQTYLANTLVRKGVYTISTDRRYIIRKDKTDERPSF